MEIIVTTLEIIGAIAFAVSGALVGIRKNMDVFGVCVLGLSTAVGGGVIRDLILGVTRRLCSPIRSMRSRVLRHVFLF